MAARTRKVAGKARKARPRRTATVAGAAKDGASPGRAHGMGPVGYVTRILGSGGTSGAPPLAWSGNGSGSGTDAPPLGAVDAGRRAAGPSPARLDAGPGPHATSLARLDPLLHLAAHDSILRMRTAGKRAAGGRIAKQAAPAKGSFDAARCSIAAQVSTPAAKAFVRDDVVAVLLDTTDAAKVQKQLAGSPCTVTKLTDHTLAARVPRALLTRVSSLAGVKYVEASVKLDPLCDLAHSSAGLVRAGQRVVPERGKGVLVGIVDTGIDAAHPAFQVGGKSRIVDYWDQVTDRRYTSAQIDAGKALASPDEIGHGTHVAGIAAGNGGGSDQSRYEGVAPEARLAIVKTTFDTADIARGVQHIFDLTTGPCVVNLSLGGHFGGHDGSSILERTIDQLSGPGRVVVVSAGNEAGARIHAGTELPAGSPSPARWTADFDLHSRVVDQQLVGFLAVQVWHQREDDLIVRLRAPNGEIFEAPPAGTAEVNRQVFLVQANHQRAAYSGDHQTTFTVIAVPQTQWLAGWSLVVDEDRSQGRAGVRVGSVHAWIVNREMGNFKSGERKSHLVGMPGTAFSAITVGSYATRDEWRSADENQPNVKPDAIHLEDVSYFSSPGPSRDGCTKPEVAAPGQWLIAPLSAGASEEEMPPWLRMEHEPYAALQGTSMAAPYVTGAVALLFQRHDQLDWAEVKRRLIKSTLQDTFTRPCWNARWGYGKLDVERFLSVEPE